MCQRGAGIVSVHGQTLSPWLGTQSQGVMTYQQEFSLRGRESVFVWGKGWRKAGRWSFIACVGMSRHSRVTLPI